MCHTKIVVQYTFDESLVLSILYQSFLSIICESFMYNLECFFQPIPIQSYYIMDWYNNRSDVKLFPEFDKYKNWFIRR